MVFCENRYGLNRSAQGKALHVNDLFQLVFLLWWILLGRFMSASRGEFSCFTLCLEASATASLICTIGHSDLFRHLRQRNEAIQMGI